MPLTPDEIIDNVYNIAKDIFKATTDDSDGGSKVTLSEIIQIVSKNGINVVNDIND